MFVKKYLTHLILLTLAFFSIMPSASAQERLCDPSFEDCRTPLLNLIRNETVGIDVAFWFMEDSRYATELIRRHQAGVPIRVIIDPRANSMYPVNAQMLADLSAAGIPMRRKLFDGYMHMKMMLFVGQNQLEFSGANYSPHAFKPETPFVDYVDEAIYFTDDPNVINSFKTKYDNLWTDTVEYGNYANITGPLQRNYPTFPIDPELNFPPQNSFAQRSLNRYNAETVKIDVIMFRITDSRHPDAMIAAKNRGVPVRLITEPDQYRNPDYVWHSYNVDRMYMAGIPIKHTKHLGLNHQKTTILYGQAMSIFGSSNWTGASSSAQQEHNYFTKKSWIFTWFVDQFERKWNSSSEFEPFVPQPPGRPDNRLPADQALGQPTTVTLTWEGGPWSHRYDVYLGTDPNNLQLIATDIRTGDPDRNLRETYALTGLSAGTTYYWKVRGKTMAQLGKDGLVWSFTTAGTAPIPPAPSSLTASAASTHQIDLSWSDVSDDTGYKVERSPNGSSSWVQIGTTAANVVTFQDQGLTAGTRYFYRVRAFNSAGNSPYSNTANATTLQVPPPATDDVVLYASEAAVKVGNWTVTADSTAAGGARLHNPNAGAARVDNPLANPSHYFEMTFDAEAGRPYRLWLRGKADSNGWANDSVHVQFSGSVTSGGSSIYRIGTTSATFVNLEDCSGCGISGWGWQDNGYGTGVLGPEIYFQFTGTQTIRIQVREDGFSIDQIVLSPSTFLNTAPGPLKNDNTILPESGGGAPQGISVTSISPSSGPSTGGTSVTIGGAGFQPGATVSMGGAAATSVVVVSGTSITAVTPSHAAGVVDVVVTNSSGQNATLAGGYNYTPPPQQNQPPQVTVSASPTSGSAPLTVSFTSTASDPDGTIVSYAWDFGNGQTSTQPSPTHVYQTGTYTARVTVTDNDGATATASVGITVTNPPPIPPGPNDIVLYASEAAVKVGNWTVTADSTAAGGARLRNPNASLARIDTPLANPSHYFEMTFNAQAGTPYRLWVRGKADSNGWANDSVHVQFSGSVTSGGSSIYRIGTTSATFVNLEDCSGCGISGWGWQDNGWGTGVLGPLIYFQTSGVQTIRIQVREDGFSIDQIVLSPDTFLTASPGALKNDTVILPRQ